jgi:hypothetical protein
MESQSIEKIAFEEFNNVGDDGLFPNHTDKDIWVNGFIAGMTKANIMNGKLIDEMFTIQELQEFILDSVEDYAMWDDALQGEPYPYGRQITALRELIEMKVNK